MTPSCQKSDGTSERRICGLSACSGHMQWTPGHWEVGCTEPANALICWLQLREKSTTWPASRECNVTALRHTERTTSTAGQK